MCPRIAVDRMYLGGRRPECPSRHIGLTTRSQGQSYVARIDTHGTLCYSLCFALGEA
ncbi:MAG: hypothetical protein IH987_07690 [Planctomycetes bacterium]|nr:hypothetical protein [Planctomycetota bacterium]